LKIKDEKRDTGGGLAWLPWRVSYNIGEELGMGRGIWLGSIFDVPDTGAPVWPSAGMAVIDWFGRGCGVIPNILGGCIEPGIGGGGATYHNSKIQNPVCWSDWKEIAYMYSCNISFLWVP
jgi:hypothetical protein